jgi:2-polyprenyl-6-methoxyphenol hydroxylase-like FAD-dependent oxidoreductase
LLLTAAKRAGVDCRLGCPLLGLTEDDEGVTLTIPGGIERFDCVVGADGLRSSVRRLAMPDLPGPVYNGLVGTGGIVDLPQIAPTGGLMRMTFGRSAFFGYIKAPDGPVHWFDSYPAPAQPGESDSPQRMAAALHARHRDDPLANAEITRAITALDRVYPDYDMPRLSHWSTNRVGLMGDAAHAVTPHSGQGASMALEDALVLAGCFAAETTLWTAFRRFEALRRGRVAAAIALGRQGGQQKKAQSALALWLRDLILPRVLPLGQRAQERLFAFRADLSPLSPPQQ